MGRYLSNPLGRNDAPASDVRYAVCNFGGSGGSYYRLLDEDFKPARQIPNLAPAMAPISVSGYASYGTVQPSGQGVSLDPVFALLWWLDRAAGSRFGTALVGIRDNEIRMRALGYPVYLLQLTAFVVAGAIAGLAGALLATGNSFVSPSMMHWTQSATLIVMVIIGGLGRRWGGPVGAAVWLALEEALKLHTSHWHMPLGLLLIATALYAPKGLAALSDLWARSKP